MISPLHQIALDVVSLLNLKAGWLTFTKSKRLSDSLTRWPQKPPASLTTTLPFPGLVPQSLIHVLNPRYGTIPHPGTVIRDDKKQDRLHYYSTLLPIQSHLQLDTQTANQHAEPVGCHLLHLAPTPFHFKRKPQAETSVFIHSLILHSKAHDLYACFF